MSSISTNTILLVFSAIIHRFSYSLQNYFDSSSEVLELAACGAPETAGFIVFLHP